MATSCGIEAGRDDLARKKYEQAESAFLLVAALKRREGASRGAPRRRNTAGYIEVRSSGYCSVIVYCSTALSNIFFGVQGTSGR